MSEPMRQLRAATHSLHRNMKDTADTIGTFLVDAFHLLALFAIGATTVWSAAAALFGMAARGHASAPGMPKRRRTGAIARAAAGNLASPAFSRAATLPCSSSAQWAE
jgi:hypothetical protein